MPRKLGASPKLAFLLIGLAILAGVLIRPLLVAAPAPSRQKAAPPIAWVELGPDGAAIARAITPDAACPEAVFSAGPVRMQPRSQSVRAYPVLVCEVPL